MPVSSITTYECKPHPGHLTTFLFGRFFSHHVYFNFVPWGKSNYDSNGTWTTELNKIQLQLLFIEVRSAYLHNLRSFSHSMMLHQLIASIHSNVKSMFNDAVAAVRYGKSNYTSIRVELRRQICGWWGYKWKTPRKYEIIFAQIVEYLNSIDFDIRRRMTLENLKTRRKREHPLTIFRFVSDLLCSIYHPLFHFSHS